jgi:hypothetical protein
MRIDIVFDRQTSSHVFWPSWSDDGSPAGVLMNGRLIPPIVSAAKTKVGAWRAHRQESEGSIRNLQAIAFKAERDTHAVAINLS